ncbi:hypothetical protein V5799_012249 [Amblyomma americanum]|uniref:O-methyltransferase n=1 Tax=Amblyomma americanum TaxID=6943 RepID=A0AAQ4EEZ2_AMBAM
MEPSAGSTSSSDPNRSLPGSWHPMPNSGHYVKTDHLAPGVAEYAASHSAPLHPVLAKLCTAGVGGKIEIVFGDAKKSLDDLISRGSCGHFDFIFIDADKESIDDYYERSLQLVRRNGVIAVDNVLWHTRTYDPAVNDPDTEAIRRLNRKLAADDRVEMCMLTMGDGVTLAVKK